MKKRYLKISERITLTMAFWLVSIAVAATTANYWHIYGIVTQITKNNLQEYIDVRVQSESQTFKLAERSQKALEQRTCRHLSLWQSSAHKIKVVAVRASLEVLFATLNVETVKNFGVTARNPEA